MEGRNFLQNFWPFTKIESEYGISSEFIYKLRRERGLPIKYLGNKPFVSPLALEALMEEKEFEPKKK